MSSRVRAFVVVSGLFAYFVVAGSQAIVFIRRGSPLYTLIGIGILLIPLSGLWMIYREMQFSSSVKRMAAILDEASDTIDLTTPNPDDWRSWFQLAASYDAVGDRKKARAAMHKALDLFRAAAATAPV